jgi:hypothetical protein
MSGVAGASKTGPTSGAMPSASTIFLKRPITKIVSPTEMLTARGA